MTPRLMGDPAIDPSVPPSGPGCVECLASADGWWFHLRRCATCGHIGCCDTSPSQHATQHNAETGQVVLSGTGEELLASDEVRKAYLGE